MKATVRELFEPDTEKRKVIDFLITEDAERIDS
jgi:hypothetical protein